MTGEIIAIIGVGIALVAFNWRVMVRVESRLDGRIDRLDERMNRLDGRIDRLELRFNGIEKEVHGLGREFSEFRGEMRGSRP
ncbi:MAG: hypothetical protein OXK20_08160 [Deltaproteobacteria bacterium]|nr:hypothetical protein [Deltaproteobacteria bacterium]